MISRTVRGIWGALLLLDPGLALRLGGGADSRQVRLAMRILGTRHLVEALVLTADRGPRPRGWIRAIDATHALSMVGLAAVSPGLRRDALLSAASASGLVALSMSDR